MKLLRFIVPFLFVRNWQSGAWELSQHRCVLFGAFIVLVVLGLGAAYILHLPAEHSV